MVGILESQQRMKEIGLQNWLCAMNDLFSCPQCKIVISAYHLACRKCGITPGCKFILQHKNWIERYLSK
jgi:hypothetical protein